MRLGRPHAALSRQQRTPAVRGDCAVWGADGSLLSTSLPQHRRYKQSRYL